MRENPMDDPNQRVAFGTSGHRGSSLSGSFNEADILAVTQAICDYRSGIDAPATPAQKAALGRLLLDALKASTLAGEPMTNRLTRAPGNNAATGGLKITTHSGWFAARPSGTENIYKLYAESFGDQAHLDAIVSEAQKILSSALRSAPSS